ncbi:MAG TPA: SAM-dependent methyltransferase, partial [Myxococcales bacterium]|nr:SAM-dependent methyltransferase [Myxococcales bacterium]
MATPIGNLGDLTQRAREVLAACDAVVAEDTRHSGQLLKHLGLEKPFLSLPAFDEAARADGIVRRLVEGASLALVTDAGTPAVSDPGALLVR